MPKIYRPTRDSTLSYAEELRRQDEASGFAVRHVVWGPDAGSADTNEKARTILFAQWEVERGYCATIHTLDQWTLRDACRRAKGRLYRFLDWIFDIRNPYAKDDGDEHHTMGRYRRVWNYLHGNRDGISFHRR